MKLKLQRTLYILLAPVLGKKLFQGFFESLYLLSLAGMNYGLVTPERSGEKYLLRYLKSRFNNKHKKIIFDVGANRGEYVAHVLDILKDNVLIYAFEPLKEAGKVLKKNFSRYQKVKILNTGLSDKKGRSVIYFDENISELASLYKRQHLSMSLPVKLDKKETIDLTTLDWFCIKNRISRIDLVKIDAEGNELKVLQGAKNMLGENRINFIQSGTYFRDIYLLLSPNFYIYRLLQDGLARIKKYDEKQEIFIMSNFVAINKSLKLNL
jgi:FkbM family methyltransferase